MVLLKVIWVGGAAGLLFSTKYLSLNVFLMMIYLFIFWPVVWWLKERQKRFSNFRQRYKDDGLCKILYKWLTRTLRVDDLMTGPTETTLRVDGRYLNQYFALSLPQTRRVTSTLQDSPIHRVQLDLWGVECYWGDRWRLFCDALGSNASVKNVDIRVIHDTAAGSSEQLALMVLQAVRQISNLTLHSAHQAAWNSEALGQALRMQQCLESMEYSLPATTYRHVLPAIQRLESLKSITLTLSSDQYVRALNTEALSQFLSVSRSLDALHLRDVAFADSQAWDLLCQGVAASHFASRHLHNLAIPDEDTAAPALGDALSLSQIRQLTLSTALRHKASNFSSFLAVLSGVLSAMQLLSLDLELLSPYRDNPDNNDDFVCSMQFELLMVIYAAAKCKTLVELKLPRMQYSDALDEALANLLQAENSSLKTLSMIHPFFSTEAPTEEAAWSLPKFLEALRSNVTIKSVELNRPHPSYPDSSVPDLWCKTFQQQVKIITRLNRHGRAYMRDDPCNTIKGVKLLGAVKDDINCLYFHLREHPALCCRSSLNM